MNRKNPVLKWALIGGSAMVFIIIYLFNKTLKEDQEKLYYYNYNSGTLPKELPTKTGNDDKVIEQKSDSIAMWRDRYLAAIAEKNQKGAVAGISQDSVDKLNKQIKYMENSIKTLNTEKGTLEKSNKSLTDSISDLNRIVVNLNSQITRNSALLDSIKTLNTEKGTLEKSNGSLTDSISNLNRIVVNLNSQITKLNKENGDLNTKNKTFENTNGSLTDSISDLNKIVTDLNRQIAQLNKENGDLNTKNKTFENTNKSLTDSISNLNIRVVNLNSQIEKLKEKGNLNINNESGNKYIGNNVEIKNGSSNSGNIIIGSGNYCR